MKEKPIDKAMKESNEFQSKHKTLPTYAELERLTEISQTSLASLAVKHKVKLCRKLTKQERSENMKKALRGRA
jgi:hypothetical protein